MLDTVVISGDDVCCNVVLGTLVGVFVFSVMWSKSGPIAGGGKVRHNLHSSL